MYGPERGLPYLTGYHVRRAFERPQGELRELASEADRLGYSTIWISEAWGRDAFQLLAQLALVTRHARLGTGIANAFSRSPGTLAMAAATLDEASGGRAVLGLGVSGPRVIEDWHGLAWERPGRRLIEVTEIVRLALSGRRVDYEGQLFRLRGFRLQFAPLRAELPIYWGVYSQASIRSAGRHADGWLAGEVPLAALPTSQQHLAEGAAEAGRSRPPTSMMLQVTACRTERELAAAQARLRSDIAYRIGGLGRFHRSSLAERGFAGECERVATLWAAHRREEAAAAVSDVLVAALGCAGSPAEVLAFVEGVRAAGVEEPLVTLPQGTPAELVVQTLSACALGRATG